MDVLRFAVKLYTTSRGLFEVEVGFGFIPWAYTFWKPSCHLSYTRSEQNRPSYGSLCFRFLCFLFLADVSGVQSIPGQKLVRCSKCDRTIQLDRKQEKHLKAKGRVSVYCGNTKCERSEYFTGAG